MFLGVLPAEGDVDPPLPCLSANRDDRISRAVPSPKVTELQYLTGHSNIMTTPRIGGMNKMRIAMLTFVMLAGCATMPQGGPVEIISDPPGAAISVNGAYVGDAPISVSLPTRCVWVGLLNAPGGSQCELVRVQAEPRSGMPGKLYSRMAMVNPQETKKIRFNLNLEPVAPTQTVEVK